MPQMTRQNQVIYYNGYANFGPYTKCEALECRPEKDSSGRTTVGNRYTLRLRTVVTGPTVKVESERMRKALSKNGGKLIVTGLASGDIRVNDGVRRDIAFGPWVDTLSFDPTYGGELATLLVWSVSWLVPECDDAQYFGKVSEFSYTVSYSQDEASYGTRVIDLRLRIPQQVSQDGLGRVLDSPENYALSVLPPEIPGFRRKFGTRTINEDRTELRWQITDEQLPGQPPYPGVVKEDGSFSLSSDSTMGVMWNGTISYECELPPNGSLNTAIDAMSSFINYRTDLLRRLKDSTGKHQATVVPVSFSVSEPECFGRKKFSFSISLTITTSLRQLLLGSGMWTETPGRNWLKWSASLQDTALNPFGYYELQMDVGQDRVTSLCGNSRPKVFTQNIRLRPQIRDIFGDLNFPPTTPLNSWRVYKNTIYLEQESGIVGTRTLPTIPLTGDTDRGGTLVSNGTDPFGGGLVPGVGPGGRIINIDARQGENSATRVVRPKQWVVMIGEAVRIGFPIPQPSLEKVNGVDVILDNRPDMGEGFKQWADFSNGQQTFYKARWKFRYSPDGDLPDKPLPPAPNPLMGQ